VQATGGPTLAPPSPLKAQPSPILAVIDRMMAAPAPERSAPAAVVRNPHAGAAAATPVLGHKALTVERPGAPRDELDEAAELFRVVFKGEILPNS
jgi:hypothetical protein